MLDIFRNNDGQTTPMIFNDFLETPAAAAASQKFNWRIEDIIGSHQKLDFSKPFMPESFARVKEIDFLKSGEKLILNQIRGHAYLAISGMMEEFVLPFVRDRFRPSSEKTDYLVRIFQEDKHIRLFRRFREEFKQNFRTQCVVIGPPLEVVKAILFHQPLCAALTILQLEWMLQRHYVKAIKENRVIDHQFKSLLRYYWLETSQNTKLHTLIVEELAAGMSARKINKAFDEYLEIRGFLDEGLKQQTRFDLESFERAAGRRLTDEELEKFMTVQLRANRWTYTGAGMTHPNFLATLEKIHPLQRKRIEVMARKFC